MIARWGIWPPLVLPQMEKSPLCRARHVTSKWSDSKPTVSSMAPLLWCGHSIRLAYQRSHCQKYCLGHPTLLSMWRRTLCTPISRLTMSAQQGGIIALVRGHANVDLGSGQFHSRVRDRNIGSLRDQDTPGGGAVKKCALNWTWY